MQKYSNYSINCLKTNYYFLIININKLSKKKFNFKKFNFFFIRIKFKNQPLHFLIYLLCFNILFFNFFNFYYFFNIFYFYKIFVFKNVELFSLSGNN